MYVYLCILYIYIEFHRVLTGALTYDIEKNTRLFF